jgi:hypothetical protein
MTSHDAPDYDDDISLVAFSIPSESLSSDDEVKADNNNDNNNMVDSILRDHMLNIFPLTAKELDQLLHCYAQYKRHQQQQEQQQEQKISAKEQDSNHQIWLSTLLKSSSLPLLMDATASSFSPFSCSNTHVERVRQVEETLLSEIPRLLLHTLSVAWVLESPPILSSFTSNTTISIGNNDDDDDDETNQTNSDKTVHTVEEVWKFLEAMTLILGRRGSEGLLRTLYHVVRSDYEHDNDDKEPMHVRLLDFVYRLIVASHHLSVPTTTKSPMPNPPLPPLLEQPNAAPSSMTAPKAWKRSLEEYMMVKARIGGERGGGERGDCSGDCSNKSTDPMSLSLSVWIDWATTIAPQIYRVLPTFIHYAVFTAQHPFRPFSCPPLALPTLVDDDDNNNKSNNNKTTTKTSALWSSPYQSVPVSLALLSPHLGGRHWNRLYSTNVDGFSFPIFQQALVGYQGPTVLLIQTMLGDVFGYYTNCPWKNTSSPQWYGGSGGGGGGGKKNETTTTTTTRGYESFLFAIEPTLQLYGPKNDDQGGEGGGGGFGAAKKPPPYYMYLYNPVGPNTRRSPGVLTGLAVGGINDSTPRLHIPLDMEHCKAGIMDRVYQSGPILSSSSSTNHNSNDDINVYFDIDVLEVWAIPATKAQHEQGVMAGQLQALIRETHRIQAAQVDRKQFLEDFQSGQYINSLFTHRQAMRGRHSFRTAEEEGKGYFLEDKSPTPQCDTGFY